MTKTGFLIFALLLALAFGFFLKLAYEVKKDAEGAPERREVNMEKYVEEPLQ